MKILLKKTAAIALALALVDPGGQFRPAWGQSQPKAKEAAKPIRAGLETVEVGPDRVRLKLSAPAKYSTFITNEPPRLVLELLNTEFNLEAKTQEGKGRYLKRVRSGQFAGEPNPVTRVVLDMSETVNYRIRLKGDDIEVLLGSEAVGLPAAAARPAPPPAKSPAPPPPPAPKSPAVAVSTRTAAAKAAPPEATPAKAGSLSTQYSKELSEMSAQKTAETQERREPPPPPAAPRPGAQLALRRTKRDILATLPRDPITLDFDNTEIGDILKLMAVKADINIIYGQDVSGALSLHLASVPFNEAFNIVMSMRGLVATQAGENILRILTPQALDTQRKGEVGVTRVFTLAYKKATDVKGTIDAVRTAEKRTGSTVVDEANNALIVTETPEGLAAVERLLAQVDTRPQQVLIEAKLVEVVLNKDFEFGIQWEHLSLDRARHFGQTGLDVLGGAPVRDGSAISTIQKPFDQATHIIGGQGPVGAQGRGTGVFLPADKIFGAFSFGRITNNYYLSATLAAASSQGKVKVLSDPKIATINGRQAVINITTAIPYVTSNVSSTGVATQSVAYTTTGIQLQVTPTVNADGRILLQVAPKVSKPSATAVSAGGTGAISVDSRDALTNVIVKDGETIVIGGLITDSLTDNVAKIPLLGDIPFLGWLFKKKTVIRSRVELLIFVTTKILPE